jgi:hypothetical protein
LDRDRSELHLLAFLVTCAVMSSAFSSPRSWIRNSSRLLVELFFLPRSLVPPTPLLPASQSYAVLIRGYVHSGPRFIHPVASSNCTHSCSTFSFSSARYPHHSSLLPPPAGTSRSSLLARSFLPPPFVFQSASSPCVPAVPFHCSYLRLRPTSSRSFVHCFRPAPLVPFFLILSRYFGLRWRPSPSAVQLSSRVPPSFAVRSLRVFSPVAFGSVFIPTSSNPLLCSAFCVLELHRRLRLQSR